MTQSKTQQWLQEIYKRPELYEGKVVLILNDTRIVGMAEGFAEASRKREELITSASPEMAEGRITLFLVPHHVTRLRIPTLRMKSLREDLWVPTYPVTLQTDHGEIKDHQMLIDSGADMSLITLKAGKDLGLVHRDEDVLLTARGVGGTITYLLKKIRFVIDQHPVNAAVAWCQDEGIEDIIVGRQDVFDAFHIEFRQNERRLIFTPVKGKESE
jgi:hypothetical protein